MMLFTYSNSGNAGSKTSMTLYSCKIYDGTALIHSYTPCSNASGTVGLWDEVSGAFHGDAAGGAFTAGPVVDPMTPHDGHNTNIGGVAREIDVMTVNIGGVAREVKSGTVLIDGVVREISLSSGPYEVSVEWYPGGESSYSSTYWPITVGGQLVTVGDVLVVDDGTTITAGARTPNSIYADSRVYMNGAKVAGGTSLNKTYSYTFEVTGPVTIQLKTNKSGSDFTGGWTYVTME